MPFRFLFGWAALQDLPSLLWLCDRNSSEPDTSIDQPKANRAKIRNWPVILFARTSLPGRCHRPYDELLFHLRRLPYHRMPHHHYQRVMKWISTNNAGSSNEPTPAYTPTADSPTAGHTTQYSTLDSFIYRHYQYSTEEVLNLSLARLKLFRYPISGLDASYHYSSGGSFLSSA